MTKIMFEISHSRYGSICAIFHIVILTRGKISQCINTENSVKLAGNIAAANMEGETGLLSIWINVMDFPKNCLDCPVWKKSLFRDFGPDLIHWVTKKKQTVNLRKKAVLFKQGQNVEGIYCHLNGLSKVVQKDANGNVRFSRLVFPGDTSGHRSIFIETQYKGTADVVSDTLQACYIPKTDILYLLSNDVSFAKNLIIKISQELIRSEEEQISAKQNSVRGRISQLLYALCEVDAEPTNENQLLIKAEITKVDIANFLSVANETVIRLMSEMKSDGLISYRGKKILINNIDELKTLSKL